MAETLPRNATRVQIRPAHIDGPGDDDCGVMALAVMRAVRDAIGDPGAWPEVDQTYITVRQPFATWHAETPEELAELLEGDWDVSDRRAADARAMAKAGMAKAGMLAYYLEWREGEPPETEGW